MLPFLRSIQRRPSFRVQRIANDGIVLHRSLMLGVVAGNGSHETVVLAGVAGLVSGTMAMAAGEFVSVGSQAETEAADLAMERAGLETDPEDERQELAAIYVARGLTSTLALEVATQLMAHDALGAHARDEIGITDALRAKPLQAALASGTSFAAGAIVPLLTFIGSPQRIQGSLVGGIALVCLALLGGLAARVGGASVWRGCIKVLLWGALAMAITAGVGRLVSAIG